jgi:UDP-N-acetyl-D-glucosamine dehydrogenase
MPDLSQLEAACRDVAQYLGPSKLVILESATYPGTTEHFVLPILQSSGLRAGRDFLVACAPDRVDLGNEEFPPRSVPKVVGGFSPEATGVAALFYSQMVDKVIAVSSCRTAELSKLLDKTFRHVNIALVNEMAMLCHEMGIDVWEVIDAAASKPFGFMTFYPGPGVGGQCMPLNPTYPAWQSQREVPAHADGILERAQAINGQMPGYVASRITQALMDAGKGARGGTVLVLGVSYKPDVADIHESPALKTIGHLRDRGAVVSFHDPYVSEVMANGSVLHRTELTRRAVESADCVAILTPHRVYDLEWIVEHAQSVFDARNAYRDDRNPKVRRL